MPRCAILDAWRTPIPATRSPTASCGCSRRSPPRGPCRPPPRSDAAAGLPTSTAHRIVGDLIDAGLLERDDDRRVRIGLRLWELATRSSHALRLRQLAMPAMERVQARVREHTQLAILEQDEALFLERLSGPDSGSNVTRIAGRLPVHASSSGLVLLAFGDHDLQERILAGKLTRVAPETITDAVDPAPQARRGAPARACRRAGLHRERGDRRRRSACATRRARSSRRCRSCSPRDARSIRRCVELHRCSARDRARAGVPGLTATSSGTRHPVQWESRRRCERPSPRQWWSARRRRRHDHHRPHPRRDRRRRPRRAAALAPAGRGRHRVGRDRPAHRAKRSRPRSAPASSSRARSRSSTRRELIAAFAPSATATTASSCASPARGIASTSPRSSVAASGSIPQHEVLKDLIAARLAAGQDLRFGVTAERVEDAETSRPARRSRRRATAQQLVIEAEFVVGADGSRSVVRPAVTGSSTGGYFREYPFAWFGILCEAPPSAPELIYSNSDERVRAHQPAQRRPCSACTSSATPMSTRRRSARQSSGTPCRRACPASTCNEGPIFQRDVLRFRSFVAHELRHGRAALVGDAAHTVPPDGREGHEPRGRGCRASSSARCAPCCSRATSA